MISHAFLTTLATRDPGDGSLSEEEQATYVMAVPEMAAELLRRRGADAPDSTAQIRAMAIEAQLFMARSLIRQPDVPANVLRIACQILTVHSHDPFEHQAATEVLAEMNRGAA